MEKSFVSKFFVGIFSTSFGTAVTVGFHFFSIMVMVRYLSKEDLGLYFLVIAVVNFFKIISGLGLELTLVKFITNDDVSIQKNTAATVTVTRSITTILVCLFLFAFGNIVLPIFGINLVNYIPYIILLFIVINFKELFLGLMQGKEKYKEYSLVEILSAALRVIFLLALRNRLSAAVLINIEIFTLLPPLFVQIFVLRATLFSLSYKNVHFDFFKKLINFSIPLYFNNVITYLFDRSSVLLIGALTLPASVAAFEIALKIPEGFMRLFNSFIVVYFPSQSKLFSGGRKDAAVKFMNYSLILISTGIIFLVLVAFLFGEKVIVLLFSDEYIEVTLGFVLLMFNFYLRAIANILGYSLVSAGYSSAPVKTNIISMIVNIVSCLILIPKYGYMGAVYALLLMNITSQFFYVLKLRRVDITPDLGEYVKPVLVVAGLISVYLILGEDNFIVKLLFLALYLLFAWFFIGEVQKFIHGTFSFIKQRFKMGSA